MFFCFCFFFVVVFFRDFLGYPNVCSVTMVFLDIPMFVLRLWSFLDIPIFVPLLLPFVDVSCFFRDDDLSRVYLYSFHDHCSIRGISMFVARLWPFLGSSMFVQ